MKNKVTKLFLLLLGTVLIASLIYPAEKGTLKLIVVDIQQGQPIPGVPVTITSPVLMGEKTSISNIDGIVNFINLTPGIYQATAKLEGFKTIVSKGIRISLNEETVVNLSMETTEITETITVTATASAVNTTKSTVSEHVSHDAVESLPVARDFVGYLQLAAGVNMVPNSGGRDTPDDPAGKGGLNYLDRGSQGIAETAFQGKRGSRDNLYFLDGMNVTGMASQTALLAFNNEVIQEQELLTSGVPAEYGGGKGVVGNIVTKSGGNKLSGSVNIYAQSKGLFLPYGGSDYTSARDDPDRDHTMLEGYEDNKYDTALTLGGPVMKDKIWFFLSGQYRNDDNTFELSDSASTNAGEEVTFSDKRGGVFGKLSLKLSGNDSLSFMYFMDTRKREGERDKNLIRTRARLQEWDYNIFSAYYQRVLSDNLLVDFRYGHYQRTNDQMPRHPEAGVPYSVLYMPGTYPDISDYNFGAYYGDSFNYKNTRDQFSLNLEWFKGNMRIKAGVMYTNETDNDREFKEFGETLQPLDPNLGGITLGELVDTGTWSLSEFGNRLLPRLNANWDSTSAAIDTNGDGVVSEAELRAVTFTDMGEHGWNFTRDSDVRIGANKVRAMRFTGYIMDDWRINDYFTLNAGLRAESHRYRDSEGGVILNMDWVLLPRIGLVWDIGGKGRQKLTAFYGHFSDPMPFGMIHFAGNISGQITHEQIWLNHAWYSYRIRGSEEERDARWTPNTKDGYSKEFSLTHEIDIGNGIALATQGYMRFDRNIIEDYDLFTYVTGIDPGSMWSHLALEYSDFGYSEAPADANYFLSNLIGGKRDIYGLDFELSKRFKNGSNLVFQYSFKYAEGNTQSDGNADLQGDIIEIDPRNEWMMGPTPGTIPHKIKIFGTYRTKFGLDIGAMLYWNSGWKYTESYVFLPGRYWIYLNYTENWADDFAKTGQEKTPPYYQIDLKFNYTLNLSERIALDLFLDIYNVTNNQAGFDVQYGRNDPDWHYKEITELLLPMRFYLGARLRF
jgi:hypothetical protein